MISKLLGNRVVVQFVYFAHGWASSRVKPFFGWNEGSPRKRCRREIPRPAGKNAGLRDDACGPHSNCTSTGNRLRILYLGFESEVRRRGAFVFPLACLTAPGPYVTSCNATMTNTKNARLKNMGEVEQLVMDYIWTNGPCSSEACREGLAASRPMKDSTIRTVLRRLEEKGFLTHQTEGRTFIYKASDARQNVAVRAVKAIIDRFCGGSAEQLVLGMVDNAVLNRKQLERLARKIAEKTNADK
jgi:BlaI family penicillinase repressor